MCWSYPTTLKYLSFLTAAGVLTTTGCSTDEDRVATFPVSGQVLHNGTPATGAKVILIVSSESLRGKRIPTPQGTVDETGNFQIGCYSENDGAPAGEYGIAIVWRDDSVNTSRDEKPPDRLAGRFANPQRSGLTATITEGKNELPSINLD